jgi:hypothetical protein
MLQQRSSLTRLIAAGLAAAAIAPAAAVAVPIDGGPGVTQDLRAPDQVTPGNGTPSNGAPQWPTNPRPIPRAQPATSDGGGVDAALIAIGGAALVATGGLGLAYRKRAGRQRQVA